jgi:hypothetical protein
MLYASIAAIVVLGILTVRGLVQITIARTVTGLISQSDSITITDNLGIQANQNIPPAQPGTLTTRTNNTSGTLTMTNSNHGISTGQRVDLYWAGGACYGAVVGTVAGVSVPIASVSGGSNLPTQGTVLGVGIATVSPFVLTGNNVQALSLYAPTRGYFVFNNGSIDVANILVPDASTYVWKTGDPITNPLAGVSPTLVYMSNSDQTVTVVNQSACAVTH